MLNCKELGRARSTFGLTALTFAICSFAYLKIRDVRFAHSDFGSSSLRSYDLEIGYKCFAFEIVASLLGYSPPLKLCAQLQRARSCSVASLLALTIAIAVSHLF